MPAGSPRHRTRTGFTLVEALTAMTIMSFGLLALSRLQVTWAQSAELAGQRAEATRLAQECLEGLRAFAAGASDATIEVRQVLDEDEVDQEGRSTRSACQPQRWADLASGSDRVAGYRAAVPQALVQRSSAVFQRRWEVAGSPADPTRAVSVSVQWADRTGLSRSVSLEGLLARADPAEIGALHFPGLASAYASWLGHRHLSIPTDAVDHGQGQSVWPGPDGRQLVLDNATGRVLSQCALPSPAVASLGPPSAASCTPLPGLLLAGYITGAIRSPNTLPGIPFGLQVQGVMGPESAPLSGVACSVGATTSTLMGAPLPATLRYACILPVGPGARWSGTVDLTGLPGDRGLKVCRFTYPASGPASPAQRHVQPYAGVAESLDNQNYFIDASGGPACPRIDGLDLMLHQDCRMSSLASAAAIPTGHCPRVSNDAPS